MAKIAKLRGDPGVMTFADEARTHFRQLGMAREADMIDSEFFNG